MQFRQISAQDAPPVALLHIQGIQTGFISSLGSEFVTCLYEAIARSGESFGLVAQDNGKTLGYIAFTANLKKLYRYIILKKAVSFGFILAAKMISLTRIKNMFETLFYPSKIKKMDLPAAELLAVVVAPEQRRKGLATQLLKKGFQQCQERRIEKVKVLVAANNEPANRFYVKHGFELAGQIDSHGITSNIYVANTGKKTQ